MKGGPLLDAIIEFMELFDERWVCHGDVSHADAYEAIGEAIRLESAEPMKRYLASLPQH
jgi:hypothetical protein